MRPMTLEELQAIYERWKRTGTITRKNVEQLRADFWNLYREVCQLKGIPVPWRDDQLVQ